MKPAISNDFGFYGILTAPQVGYEKLSQIMVECQLRFIQLRMKDTPVDQVKRTAEKLRKIIPNETIFIINDDPQIALDVGADGVHLGQGDMPYEKARELLGPDAIIGLSTHNPTQATEACLKNPDYIGIGPVWPTPTKKIADPAIGIDGMKEMLQLATVPTVVLGAIDHHNVKEVLAGGAKNLCAVRCITKSTNPKPELERMIRAIKINHRP